MFSLPQISVNGNKRIADMELYAQMFFVGQDGKDTSTILIPDSIIRITSRIWFVSMRERLNLRSRLMR